MVEVSFGFTGSSEVPAPAWDSSKYTAKNLPVPEVSVGVVRGPRC